MRTQPQSFVGGELSVSMQGRPDDPKVQQGAALLRGASVDPSGTARRLPGTGHVATVRSNRKARLIPFRGDAGEDLQIEFGFRAEYPGSSIMPGYARIYRLGAPVLLFTAWSSTTAYSPGALVTRTGVLYMCKVAHTNQVPPSFTYWESLEYVPGQTFAPGAVTVASPGIITFAAEHLLNQNEPVEFVNDAGGLPPTGLSYGTVYYADILSLTAIRLMATPGGSLLPITNAGTGTHHMYRRYTSGNAVSYLGSVWLCRTTRPILDGSPSSGYLPNASETYWYLEPTSGVLELPWFSNVSDTELFQMTHSQNANVLSLATRNVFGLEVWAGVPMTFDNYPIWQINSTIFAPPLAPPSGVAAAATKRGRTLQVTVVGENDVTGTTGRTLVFSTEHRLVYGLDFIYVEGTAEAQYNNKWWGIQERVSLDRYRVVLVDPETGAYAPTITSAPSGGTARPGKMNSEQSNSYVVTAVDKDRRESLQSAVASVTNNLSTTGAYNTVSWNAVSGATRYRVYKQGRGVGLYGLIGESTSTSFKDENIAPAMLESPPLLDATLGSATDTSPRAVTHFQGRRWLAGSGIDPQDVWGTRSNTESDMTYSLPVKDVDRIHERLKTKRAATIRHLAPIGGGLAALTDTGEFIITAANGAAITPNSFVAVQQGEVGAAAVQPQTMQDALLFVAASGAHLHELIPRDAGIGYVPVDLCERAAHLIDGYTVLQTAVQLSPVPIHWEVTSDGRLLGLTRVRSQQVLAWYWWQTDGIVESVSCGVENGEARLYLIVLRTINGTPVRHVEIVGTMRSLPIASSFFVDDGVQVATSAAVTTVSGLTHLEGKTVAVLANGRVQASRTVVGGAITLATPLPAVTAPAVNTVVVGLPNTMQVRTMPAAFAIEAYGSGNRKNVSTVWVRVQNSGRFKIGHSLQSMDYPAEMTEGALYTGLIRVPVPGTWTDDGQLYIEQADPLPLNIVSVTADLAVGGK